MAEKLRPFRDYSEHEVVNLFAFADEMVSLGVGDVVYAGSSVKVRTGWSNTTETQFLGDVGANFNNTVSERYGVAAQCEYCDGGLSEAGLGITLYDVREYDENGEALKFNPRKAAELQCVLSGQAVPVAQRGMFLMATGAWASADLTLQDNDVFATGNGQITSVGLKAFNNRIGRTLGGPDADGSILVKFDFTQV
mgnify:CR=1 FL=1|tara:strand:- start:187 stop:771 length:585 start_codon:yes stop_codon:yes gene_type:complete